MYGNVEAKSNYQAQPLKTNLCQVWVQYYMLQISSVKSISVMETDTKIEIGYSSGVTSL